MQGSASGQLWNDTVSLAGHSLDNQTVALCDEVSGALLGGNASGIMGEIHSHDNTPGAPMTYT